MLTLISLHLVLFFRPVWSDSNATNTTATNTTTAAPAKVVDVRPDLNLIFMLPFTSNGFPYTGGSAAPAILIGVRDVQDEILPGFKLGQWDVIETEYHSQKGVLKLTNLYKDYKQKHKTIHGIIGPESSDLCFSVGFIAAAYNIPEVATGCEESTFSDRKMYPTLARTTFNADIVLPELVAMLIKGMRLSNFAIVLGSDSRHKTNMSHSLANKISELMGREFKVNEFQITPLDSQSEVPEVRTKLIYDLMLMKKSHFTGTIMSKCLLIFCHVLFVVNRPRSEDWLHHGQFCTTHLALLSLSITG